MHVTRSALLVIAIVALLEAVAAATALAAEPRVVATFGDTRQARCLAPTPDALWIGTLGGGILRYDGSSVRVFESSRGLPGNRVTDCVAYQGSVWVTTEGGLAVYQAKDGHFGTIEEGRFLRIDAAGNTLVAARDDGYVFTVRDNAIDAQRVESAPTALAVNDEGEWAAGGFDGRVVFGGGAHAVRVETPVTDLAYVADRWVATTPDETIEIEDIDLPVDPAVYRLALDDPGQSDGIEYAQAWWHGRLYVATDDGVFVYDDGKRRPVAFDGPPCGDRISALARFDGNLWIGSFDRGLCRLSKGVWEHFSGSEYLPSDMINDMDADADHLYVATLAGLVVVDRDLNFQTYSADQCRPNPFHDCPWYNSVTGVSVDPGTGAVWVSDTGALHRIDGRRWLHYNHRRGIRSERVSGVAVRDGHVAASTGDLGVHVMAKPGTFDTMDDQSGPADNWVMRVAYDDKGNLWAATCTRGISMYDGKTWRHIGTNEGLIDDYTLAIQPIGREVWVGTLSGLSIIRPDGIVNLDAGSGLSGNEVHDILVWGDAVLLATDGGVTVVDPGRDDHQPRPSLLGVVRMEN